MMNDNAIIPFKNAVAGICNRYVQDSKSKGNKIVGFFCSYMPLELLHAAGVTPYRIKGLPGRDIGKGTTYLSTRLCTFCRNTLTLALENDFSFLDGFIGCNTCDQIRRTSQNWIELNPPEFTDFVHVPRASREVNISHYEDQLLSLKINLENWLGRDIGNDELMHANVQYNRARRVLRQLSDLRKSDNPPITGSEMLTVSIAFHQMPVNEFIPAAEDLLLSCEADSGNGARSRILLAGSVLDEPDYISFIEEQGFDVVADPVCFGQRSYWDDINTDKPPLTAIAERYLKHFPCARIGDSFPERWKGILDLYNDYHADGIIFQKLKFCQLWGVDFLNMSPLCEDHNIPLLQLEREYGFFSTGQLKTRLQAFSELIQDRKACDV
jgi:benzoyl-CoA reductase subunit C